MTPILCIFCDFPGESMRGYKMRAQGYLLDRVTLPICTRCRDQFLTALRLVGIVEITHPMIDTLCKNSHILEYDWYRFYDNVNQVGVDLLKEKCNVDSDSINR